MSFDKNTIFVVEYETDTSMVREYMTDIDFSNLQNDERNGNVKIMNHMVIGNVLKEA